MINEMKLEYNYVKDESLNEYVNDAVRNVYKVVNKLIPIKGRMKTLGVLLGRLDMNDVDKNIRNYVVACRAWLKANEKGEVSLEIKQPWQRSRRR